MASGTVVVISMAETPPSPIASSAALSRVRSVMRTTATTPSVRMAAAVCAAALPVPESAIDLPVHREVGPLVRVTRRALLVEVDAVPRRVAGLHVAVGVGVGAREDVEGLRRVAHEFLDRHVGRGNVEVQRSA